MSISSKMPFVTVRGLVQLLITLPILLVLAAMFVFYYGAALGLPPSLIDDYPMRLLGQQVGASLCGGGSAGCSVLAVLGLDNAGGQFAHNYRPVFDLLTWAQYQISGGAPFHFLRLMTCAITLLFVFQIPLRAVQRGRRGYFSALFGAVVAVVLCMSADVPGAFDFQSLRACWYRLHATDCYSTLFISFAALALIGSWYSRRLYVALPLYVLAAVMVLLTVFVKLSFLPIIGILVWFSFCAFCMKRRALGYSSLLLFLGVVGLLGWYGHHTQLLTKGPQGSYTSGYCTALDVRQMRDILTQYKDYLRMMFDPLFVWLALSLLVRYNRLIHTSARRFFGGMFCDGLFVIAAIALLIGYSAWPHVLPRYMLGTVFMLCALFGMTAGRQMLSVASGQGFLKSFAAILLFGMGIICTAFLPGKVIFLIGLFVIVTFWRVSSRQLTNAFLLGMLCVGTLFIAKSAKYNVREFHKIYVDTELLRSDNVMKHCFELWDAGKRIGVVAASEKEMRDNEVTGSIAGFYKQKTDRNANFVTVTDLATSSSLCDVVLFTPFTPKDMQLRWDSFTTDTALAISHPRQRDEYTSATVHVYLTVDGLKTFRGATFAEFQQSLRNRKPTFKMPATTTEEKWTFVETE